MRGVRDSRFAEDEAVVEEEIENHRDDAGKAKGAGTLDEFVGKGEMEGISDAVDEVIERGEVAKNLGEARADGDGKNNIPDKEAGNGGTGDFAFLPGDTGMGEVGDEDSNRGGEEVGEPEEIAISDD